jgi:DHA1 family multidrug resistance protein-like MFS transporter
MPRMRPPRIFRLPRLVTSTLGRSLSASQSSSWQRNLAVLWIGELIAISGFSVTQPFLPYFVQELGITGLDQVAFWAGLVASTQSTTMAIIAPVWGTLADRYGRKIMVVRAMFGGAVVIGAMGFVQNVQQLVVLRAIQGLLTGTVSAATALVASTTPPERRGFAIGLLQMSIYLGNSVGPMLGGWIADSLGYRAAFWTTSGLLLIAGVLTSAVVREQFTPPDAPSSADEGGDERGDGTSEQRRPRAWDGVLLVLRTRALLNLFGIRMLMNVAFGVIGPILPLFLQTIAAPGTKIASLSGTISGLASAAGAGSAIVMGRIGDRVGPRRILLVCGTIAGVLFGLQAWVQTPVQFATLRVLASVATGGIVAAASSLLAALAPKNRFGAVYGVNTSIMAAASAVAPMLGAALTASWGLSSAFLGAAALYGLATVGVATVIPGREKEEPTTETRRARSSEL